ncbi:hypothetical protein GCM10010521_24410 [Streptomyces rameus]|uniref:Secreted protein n=1 Tax=Streptomyces rameus TaxID=68261 RepID=A0ABP6N5T0_9ACTN
MLSVLAVVRLVVLGAAQHQEAGHGGGDHDGRGRDDRDQLRTAAAPRGLGDGRGGLTPLRLLTVRTRLLLCVRAVLRLLSVPGLRILLVPGLLVRVRLRVTRLLVRVLLRVALRVLRAPWRLLIWPHGQ